MSKYKLTEPPKRGPSEPDFVSQNGELIDSEEQLLWFNSEARAARSKGANVHRYSVHDSEPNLILYEGWFIEPKKYLEPEFHFTG